MEWMILPLKRYAQFSGRSRRMEYWMFFLFLFIVYFVFAVLFFSAMFTAIAAGRGGPGALGAMFASMGVGAVVVGLFWLAMLIPSIAVAVRRLHDTDRSGWWLMLYAGPYLLSLVLRVLALSTGAPTLLTVAGLLGIVNLVCGIVLLVFFCLPGTMGPNRFGPDPMVPDRDFAETFR